MLVGILSGVAAIVVLLVAAFIVYVIAKKRSSKKVKKADVKVKHLETVGVAPEDPLNPDVHVSDDKSDGSGDPYNHLRKRFRAVGIFIAATFGVLGAKIFSMQVVNNERYTKQAKANATTTVRTPAPRGNIFD